MTTHDTFNLIFPTDHFGWHIAYLDVYAERFAPLRESGLPVLEIGTDGGGGLLMYADYFRKSQIIGFDPFFAPEHLRDHPQIRHFMVDAYTDQAVSIAGTFGPYGVLIDDGPHFLPTQLWFAANYPRLLADNGLAIIEDIQDPEHTAQLANAVPEGFAHEVVDLREVNGRYDDILFIISKA